MPLIKNNKNASDYLLIIAVIMLAIIGTIFIFSASNYSALKTYGDSLYFVKKQIIGNESKIDYEYEGGPIKILDMLLPIYVKDIIYGIILDAKCSEHSARMNSMRNASDNAKEVIDQLQLLYNRARQNVITNELIDIIGGANAIGGDN